MHNPDLVLPQTVMLRPKLVEKRHEHSKLWGQKQLQWRSKNKKLDVEDSVVSNA